MDCLDNPDLELEILRSLAENIAQDDIQSVDKAHRPEPIISQIRHKFIGIEPESSDKIQGIELIINGLTQAEEEAALDDNNDDQIYAHESTLNHSISYTHYVRALSMAVLLQPGKAEECLKHVGRLLRFVFRVEKIRNGSAGESSQQASKVTQIDIAKTSQLFDSILHAFGHLARSSHEIAVQVNGHLDFLFHHLKASLQSDQPVELALGIKLIQTLHFFLMDTPLSTHNPVLLNRFLEFVSSLSQPEILSNLDQSISPTSSPASTSDKDGAIIPTSQLSRIRTRNEESQAIILNFSSFKFLLLITDIQGVILSLALENTVDWPENEEEEYSHRACNASWKLLTVKPVASDAVYLPTAQIRSAAISLWDEIMNGEGIAVGMGVLARAERRVSVVFGAGHDDGEDALLIALLKLLTLTSIHAKSVDESHLARLKLLLSEKAPSQQAAVMEMALSCIDVLVLNFPAQATPMAHHVRRFATTPLPIFEAEMAGTGMEVPELMIATARCLALCLKLAQDDDLINSTVYSLMNATTNPEGSTAPSIRASISGTDWGGARSAEQKRMMGISTVGMVARLALHLETPEVLQATVSMLLQRLRGSDIIMESTIVLNLVPLTIKSGDTVVAEVVKAFTQISRSANPEDPRNSANAVLGALTSLARGLDGRPEACNLFLQEILSLIIDKGAQIQLASKVAQPSDMTQQLAALLLPLDAVLQHQECQPALKPSPNLVILFRNAWFTLTVLGLTHANSPYISDATRQALNNVALKTPALVLELEKDYASGLEYNSVFRRDFASQVLHRQRHILAEYLPKLSNEIKGFSLPQVTFLMTTHDLEIRRIKQDRPSVILQYFGNSSLNDSELLSPLIAISDKLLKVFLTRLQGQVLTHSMPSVVPEEIRKLLVGATHRFERMRIVATRYLNDTLTTFSALMCDRKIVFTLLEILTLLRRSCEDEFNEEYSPAYEYRSNKIDLVIEVSDNFETRNTIATNLYANARRWIELALARAPIEMQSILQHYLRESRDVLLLDSVEFGAGLALHYAKAISKMDRHESIMPDIAGWPADSSNLLASQISSKNFYSGELSGARLMLSDGLMDLHRSAPRHTSPSELVAFRQQMSRVLKDIRNKHTVLPVPALRRLLLRAVSVLIASPNIDREILFYLVALPIRSFTSLGIAAGVDAWSWLISERPDVEVSLMSEISDGWLWTIKARKGLFSDAVGADAPLDRAIEYAPTDRAVIEHSLKVAQRALQPHTLLISVISSRFQAVKYREPGMMLSIIRLLLRSFRSHKQMCTHPLARQVRFSLVLFGLQVLSSSRLETLLEIQFRDAIYEGALSWFAIKPLWSFGSSRIQVGAEMALLEEVITALQNDHVRADHDQTSLNDRSPAFPVSAFKSSREYMIYHKERSRLIQLLIENEIMRLHVWSNVTEDGSKGRFVLRKADSASASEPWAALVRRAWSISPGAAVMMAERFKFPTVQSEINRLIRAFPRAVLDVPEAVTYLLGSELESSAIPALKLLALWHAVPPVTAVTYFQPRYKNHPLILQYAMRVLEQHPVELTFFFVPQVVQALRFDGLGYVERFIFETSKISQLFCHQIIWNMKANCYKDDMAEVEDPMKPMLDRMVDMIVAALSGKARAFYDTEFSFFNEVTSISGKLKDYIKRSKAEKKAKIDEEMAKIQVKVGVYLPSNPDGVVVELDKKSGRPLQSHAKAPFMATFKVRKERIEFEESTEQMGAEVQLESSGRKVQYDVWQAAIFKVGDDCRQDVLALQLIAMFKNIFQAAGLVLYLFPYRVTATAPGCGVIDVVPNATSRDEMGRAKINDLYSYFVDKYGSIDTIAFQKARMNFIQSMAAYSVACYILQIKDRHNGNIMIDGAGHIVHIDFGFLFDIGPGGVKFEPNSFKLNHEMVVLMGGKDSQGYRMFTELTIKAFLAVRPFADQLVDSVALMLGTGLPSFKGEPTIKRLRDRFQLQLGEREAAQYFMGVIRNAHENFRSVFYDGFQKAQNGIPY